MTTRPSHVIDPVCGMTVEIARAEAAGLLFEHEGRTYGFCRAGCKRAFSEDPSAYEEQRSPAPRGSGSSGTSVASPIIDAGMRRWYESCSCCLSDAYPEIKAQLDAERLGGSSPPVDAGICEVAEAPATAEHAHP